MPVSWDWPPHVQRASASVFSHEHSVSDETRRKTVIDVVKRASPKGSKKSLRIRQTQPGCAAFSATYRMDRRRTGSNHLESCSFFNLRREGFGGSPHSVEE